MNIIYHSIKQVLCTNFTTKT